VKAVGEEPAGGWALVIAMHGGGGVPQRVNDQQWRHMQVYYRDQLAAGGYLYCALRAPTDEWNGFYTDYCYPLIERLILQFLVSGEVDPDKVFAIGYSHGGYGAFAIGPKLPDRFAAVHASASAPTDGETSAVGLHTLPFTFMVGEKDGAYGRVDRCRAFDKTLAELRAAHPGRYPAQFHEIAGNGHTGLPDKDQLQHLLPHVRQALPRELHWELTDGVVRDHYWLAVDAPQKGQRVDATLAGNRLGVRLRGGGAVTVRLDARVVDFGQPLAVACGDAERTETLQPSLRVLCESLRRRGDPVLAASCEVVVRAP
jgi:pimeloyl-ACP methyl ester carboxylesterase